MSQDEIHIEVLPDGRIRTSTPGSISPANHSNSENFFRYIASLTDDNHSRTKLKQTHSHQHEQAKEKA